MKRRSRNRNVCCHGKSWGSLIVVANHRRPTYHLAWREFCWIGWRWMDRSYPTAWSLCIQQSCGGDSQDKRHRQNRPFRLCSSESPTFYRRLQVCLSQSILGGFADVLGKENAGGSLAGAGNENIPLHPKKNPFALWSERKSL